MQRAAAGLPSFAAPARALGLRLPALDRQHVAGRLGQSARKDAGDAVARFGILELGILRRHVRRQIGFLHQPLGRILVGRRDIVGLDAELGGDRAEQGLGLRVGRAGLFSFRGDALGVHARSASRRAASRARTSSAAAIRPGTICPGRNAGSRRERSGRAGAGSACRRARAWSGRPRPRSTRPIRSRRSRRRSARRPSSAARRRALSSLVDLCAERVERLPRPLRKTAS